MHLTSWILILAATVAYIIAKKTAARFVENMGQQKGIPTKRTVYISYVISIAITIAYILSIIIIAGYNHKDLTVVFSSVFAVLGVALFAQWSILSNVTASVLVFFFFPYRVGDKVKIIDGENTIEGRILEISLFHVILEGSENQTLTYPNSMVFQKAVSIVREKKIEEQ